MKKIIYITILILWGIVNGLFAQNKQYELPLQSDDITRLIPRKAHLKGGIINYMPEKQVFKNFWTTNFNNTNQSVEWNIIAENSPYEISAIFCPQNLSPKEKLVLSVSNGYDEIFLTTNTNEWQKILFDKPLFFKSGKGKISIKIVSGGISPDFDLQLFSLEVVKPDTRIQLAKRAKELRSNTSWMTDAKYGFFFHWNSRSMPRRGEPKSYEDAVKDFDVNRFAKMINDCGGKLIFLTTSWGEYYFPAPIKSINQIIKGRTSSRDLIADLADALNKYDIKLILYYHQGQDDTDWWNKQNFSIDNPGNLYVNIEKIITEVSQRYGNKIAGFWFDDGMGYYPNEGPFEKITRAAKSGNPENLVCFNPWIFPKLTDFQDFYAGERDIDLEVAGVNNPHLPVNGDGLFKGGPQDGLQASFNGTLEPGEWTHIYKNSDIESPKYTSEEIIEIIQESIKRKNVPMFNLRVYQDGSISPVTYEMMKEVKKKLEMQ